MDDQTKEVIRKIGEALVLAEYPHLIDRQAYIDLWMYELEAAGGLDKGQRATLWGHVERSCRQQIYKPNWQFATEAMKRIRHLVMGGDEYESIREWAAKLPEGIYVRDPASMHDTIELPYPQPKSWNNPPLDLSALFRFRLWRANRRGGLGTMTPTPPTITSEATMAKRGSISEIDPIKETIRLYNEANEIASELISEAGMPGIPGYLTTKEAAEMLGVSHGRVKQLVANGLLESVLVGRTRLVLLSSVQARLADKPGRGRPRKIRGKS